MKTIIATFIVWSASFAQAETQLTCWDIYAPRGSQPVLKAQIEEENVLSNVKINVKSPIFKDYTFEVEYQNSLATSEIHSPAEDLAPELITSNRSPYKGNNEYSFVLGTWNHHSPAGDRLRDYNARMILPTDLSQDALNSFRIRNPEERSNAVMIYDPSRGTNQAGDNYLRMFCVSK